MPKDSSLGVSIQPKPKTGLEVGCEPEEDEFHFVSIQPKPKTGLEEQVINTTYFL